MATYAITGGATGIGAALRARLGEQGHRIISVDIKQGDIIADLATVTGRQAAIAGIRQLAPDGLDGFIPCAGLPPVARPLARILQVNFFAVVATVEGLRDLLAKKRGTVLVVSSNSAPMIAADDPLLHLCLSGDEAAACAAVESRDGHTAYAGSKRAIATWMRRHVVTFANEGVRMNAIAPGITRTPLAEQVLADEASGEVMRQFADSVPWGGMAQPEDMAEVMSFMLGPAGNCICGAVFFVDGGSDAMLRPDQF